MFWISCCLLFMAFLQVSPAKTCYDIPRGLIRASDIYFLPWTPVKDRPTFPKDNPDESQASSACTFGVLCKIGDKVVSSSIVNDITGPKGPSGKTGSRGMQGLPGLSGSPGSAGCDVAFSVALKSKYIGYVRENVPLQFDKVIMNKGNAFDVEKGAFTAPVNGTYVFHVTVGAQKRKKGAVHLSLNGVFMATVWAESIQGWGSASNRLILDLVSGDALQIKVLKSASYLRDQLYTSMRGWCV